MKSAAAAIVLLVIMACVAPRSIDPSARSPSRQSQAQPPRPVDADFVVTLPRGSACEPLSSGNWRVDTPAVAKKLVPLLVGPKAPGFAVLRTRDCFPQDQARALYDSLEKHLAQEDARSLNVNLTTKALSRSGNLGADLGRSPETLTALSNLYQFSGQLLELIAAAVHGDSQTRDGQQREQPTLGRFESELRWQNERSQAVFPAAHADGGFFRSITAILGPSALVYHVIRKPDPLYANQYHYTYLNCPLAPESLEDFPDLDDRQAMYLEPGDTLILSNTSRSLLKENPDRYCPNPTFHRSPREGDGPAFESQRRLVLVTSFGPG